MQMIFGAIFGFFFLQIMIMFWGMLISLIVSNVVAGLVVLIIALAYLAAIIFWGMFWWFRFHAGTEFFYFILVVFGVGYFSIGENIFDFLIIFRLDLLFVYLQKSIHEFNYDYILKPFLNAIFGKASLAGGEN